MIEVRVSEDGMYAEVALFPESDEEITEKMVEDTMRLEGVQTGINKSVINKLVSQKIYNQFVMAAKGKEPLNGTDAWYEYFFEVGEFNGKPKIREDGSVDYTLRICNINQGDLLAEYHPETAGIFGYNVFAKMLPPVKGKPLRPLRCMNAYMEDNKYYASKDGHVTLSDNILSVQNTLEIRGDTTYDNGDINFNGDVHVNGNICNGITVKAAGSVIVEGVIENANVYAGLDIVVSKGIHGQGTSKDGLYINENKNTPEASTVVEAKGQIKSKFIDYAFVKAEGDVFVDYAVGSIIISEGKITASGSKGAIIGGSTMALFGIDAEILGNTAELLTEITVGADKNFLKRCSDAKDNLCEIRERFSECQEDNEKENLRKIMEKSQKQVEMLEQKCIGAYAAPVIVRKALRRNVKMRFGKETAPDCSGRFNVEFRKIGNKILCKTIGTYKETELNYGMIDNDMVSIAEEKPTVLVIDDDTRLLRMVHGFLEDNYHVAVATNGRVGRKYLQKNTADLIILDYMMPDENGVEVLKSLRANKETKDIPVVFLTGISDKKKIMECLFLCPAGYIMKPVSKENLLTKIHAILGDKSRTL